MPNVVKLFAAVLALLGGLAPPTPAIAAPGLDLRPCRLQGVEHGSLCGSLQRPLDPSQPQGAQIRLQVAVLPAVSRNKQPDPVFFFAGGPGQSAIALAGTVSRLMARVSNRRDLVLIDQRGTGRSAPLKCPDESPLQPLAQAADSERAQAQLRDCLQALQKLPHGDLRHYTTVIASQDAEAVRQALGAARINLVGGSYGTRAALDYQRQFPQAVRRMVLDGVAPPDMVLPASFSPDSQAAFDAVLAACEADARCRTRYPGLRADWVALLAALPREVEAAHPMTGAREAFHLTRDMVLNLVRAPLYQPTLAAALPLAVSEGARGRFEPLLGLGLALGGGRGVPLASGMHFSVVCSEDAPRLASAGDRPGADFGTSFADLYTRVCADWPRGEVPAAFYTLTAARSAVLVLSGGADPATPPRHGERVARALGPLARHVVVPQAGHGVMSLGCMSDALFHFINAATDAQALQVDAGCAKAVPRPTAFVPPARAASAAAAAPGARP
jgi:pimeloyl-ACP methyl ester carboxylesterase